VTVHAATVEVAGIALGLRSTVRKPALWATELHPAFVVERTPDVIVEVVHDGAYWRAGLPWVAPDTVADAPRVTRRGAALRVEAAYYAAVLDGDRARVRLATGFHVDGPLRALVALRLAGSGGALVRAARSLGEGGADVRCGADGRPPAGGGPGLFRGLVALVAREGRVWTHATPFGDGPAAPGAAALRALEVVAPGPPGPLPRAAAVAALARALVLPPGAGALLEAAIATLAETVALAGCRRAPGAGSPEHAPAPA
jgi:hypothetical protein